MSTGRLAYAVKLINGEGMQVDPPIESRDRDKVVREIATNGAWDTSGTIFVPGHSILTIQPYATGHAEDYEDDEDDIPIQVWGR